VLAGFGASFATALLAITPYVREMINLFYGYPSSAEETVF